MNPGKRTFVFSISISADDWFAIYIEWKGSWKRWCLRRPLKITPNRK